MRSASRRLETHVLHHVRCLHSFIAAYRGQVFSTPLYKRQKRNSLQLTSVKCKAHHSKIPHAELYYILQASDIWHSVSKWGSGRPAVVNCTAKNV
jgi:hypothetical protein